MPNTFIGHRERWVALSEIDYLGQFVKSWMAFNAWYRSNYAERQDRKIITEFKWQPNPVRNKLMPLLTRADTSEADEFRSDIALLHHRLENYTIEAGRDDDKERITLSRIFLQDRPAFTQTESYWNYSFSVDRPSHGQGKIESVAKNRAGQEVLRFAQPRYKIEELDVHPQFVALPGGLRPRIRNLYQRAEPKEIVDLLSLERREGGESPIKCGAFTFNCGKKAMFAGVSEVIYLMRCTLFHGELEPTPEASQCYEPAYRIVRRFLDCIT
jgi:hypothetical protein